MRHQVAGKKLSRDIKQRKALFKNLITSLISSGKVKTTEAKAKAIRGLVDKLLTKAKQGSLHQRRQVLTFLSKKEVVRKLFDEIAPRFRTRKGGYTRIIKIGPRRGDNAPIVVLKWTENEKVSQKRNSLREVKIKKKDDQDKTNKSKRD